MFSFGGGDTSLSQAFFFRETHAGGSGVELTEFVTIPGVGELLSLQGGKAV